MEEAISGKMPEKDSTQTGLDIELRKNGVRDR